MDYHNYFTLISEHLNSISNGVNSFWPLIISAISAIGTIILGALAIFGEQIKKIIFKPKLFAVNIVRTEQSIGIGKNNLIFQRLIVKNIGKSIAKEVRVLLTYEISPKNFIPVPLAWTHWKTSSRNIHQDEPVYIDILQKEGGYPNYNFCWPFEIGKPAEILLKEFNSDYGKLRLEFFEENVGKIGDFYLNFSKKEDILKIVK